MAAAGKVIGTVTAVAGEAKATAADGSVRILQVGDRVHSDEVIATSAGGSINVALASGKTLDCGSDVELSLHESILGVATAASAPAADVAALQAAIQSGQDPSQIAPATAAGGAPAAGGSTDGGSHEPVVLEQSNSASIVTSGFTTEGDTLAFPVAVVEAAGGLVAFQGGTNEVDQPVIPALVFEPAQSETKIATLPQDTNPESPVASEEAPLPAETPVIAATDTDADQDVAEQPIVVAEPQDETAQDEIVASNPETEQDVIEETLPPVVVTEPQDEIVASNPETEQDVIEETLPPVVVTEPQDEIVASNPEPEQDVVEETLPPVVVTEPQDEIVASNPETEQDVIEETLPPVVVTEPQDEIVASNPEPEQDVVEETLPPVVVTEPQDEIVASNPEPEQDVVEETLPPVVVTEPQDEIVASNPEPEQDVVEETLPPVVVTEPQDEIVASNPEPEQDVVEETLPPVVVTEPQDEIVASNPEPEQDVVEETLPPVVVTEPQDEIVASNPEPEQDVVEDAQPPVVVTEPQDEIVASNPEPEQDVVEDEQPPVVVTQPEGDVVAATTLLTYSISANTNQDEQLALLTLTNGDSLFQSLVFFDQQGQQKPMAAPLEFDLDYNTNTTVKLTYIDGFAGNSDATTGHTAQKIAIKDFALGDADANTLIAQESDGVNIGFVGNATQIEGALEVAMNDPSETDDDATAGPAGPWTYTNPAEDINNRVTYDDDATDSQQADTNGGFDILDVTSSALDLTALDGSELENFEVIALKGTDAQTLTLGVDDVLKVTDGDNVLHILGGQEQSKGETVQDTLDVAGSGWSIVDGDQATAGNQPSYFGWVAVKNTSGATLLVDPDVNINLIG